MAIEKTIAGPSQNPDFPNCASSSEATPYWLISWVNWIGNKAAAFSAKKQ
ncbi:hypothetical protein ACTXIZ_09370 [Psychrobacter celer]